MRDEPKGTAVPIHLTLYTRPGCHLCEVVVRIAGRLAAECPLEVRKVDISQDLELEARYGTRIPVVLLDGREVLAGTITEGDLRRAIRGAEKKARGSGPVSRILSRLGFWPGR